MIVYISPYLAVQFRDLNSYLGVLTTFVGPWGFKTLERNGWGVDCWEGNDEAADFGVAIGQIFGKSTSTMQLCVKYVYCRHVYEKYIVIRVALRQKLRIAGLHWSGPPAAILWLLIFNHNRGWTAQKNMNQFPGGSIRSL
jgi:hypothetical protein